MEYMKKRFKFSRKIFKLLQERKHWPHFEVILFDHEKELYRGTLQARSRIEASDMALAYAQVYYPDWNRIQVNVSFEMVFFNEEKELYRGILYAIDQSEASGMARAYAQVHYPDYNRLQINPEMEP